MFKHVTKEGMVMSTYELSAKEINKELKKKEKEFLTTLKKSPIINEYLEDIRNYTFILASRNEPVPESTRKLVGIILNLFSKSDSLQNYTLDEILNPDPNKHREDRPGPLYD